MTGKKILIAGGAGQIGRALVFLLQGDNELHVVDLFPRDELREQAEQAGATVWRKDLVADPLDDMPRDFDVVFNMIVHWGRDTGVEAQRITHDVNGFASGRLMQHFGETAAFVQGSTGGVYQAGSHRAREGHTELVIDCHYHEGKFAAEVLLDFMCRELGHRGAVVRYFWPFAPYDRWHGISEQYMQLADGAPIKVRSEYMAPCYISDVARLTIAAADHAASPPAIFNIGNPTIATRLEMVELQCELQGMPVPDEVPVDRDLTYLPDTRLMEEKLGPARVSWQEGLRRMHRAFVEDATRPVDWMFE